MWFQYSHAHDFGKDLRVSRSNVISNPNWQYHSKLNLIQLCRKNVKMSFGDKVIEKANEERRRLEREILCFFTLSVVSLLLSLWPPIAKYWSYSSLFHANRAFNASQRRHNNIHLGEICHKVPEARYGVAPNFLSLRTWAIFHGIETFCDISELQGIAAIGEGYILIWKSSKFPTTIKICYLTHKLRNS